MRGRKFFGIGVALILIACCIVSPAIFNADAGKPTSPGGGGKGSKEAACEIYGDINSYGKVVYAEDGAKLEYGPEFGEFQGPHTGSIRQVGVKADVVFKHLFDSKVLRIEGGERIGKPNDKLRVYRGPWVILGNDYNILAEGDGVEVYCQEYK